MTKVAIITGVPNDYSRVNGVLDYVSEFLEDNHVSHEIIKVHTLPPADLITANFNSPAIKKSNQIVEGATGVIVLTPVYKASYSGILKTYLDLLPQKGFENKLVLPLVVGGSIGHLLTIEYAINPVLTALGASHILNGVYTVDKQVERVGEENRFIIQEGAKERLQKGIDSFVKLVN